MKMDVKRLGGAQKHSRLSRWCSPLLAVGLALTGCGEGGSLDTTDGPASETAPSPTWEAFLASAYREKDTGAYIANGDELFASVEDLRAFYDAHVTRGATGQVQGQLIIGKLPSGAQDRWSDTQKRNLTYCVDQSSFATASQYTDAVNAMAGAAAAWEGAADVKFKHESSYDGDCTLARVAAGQLVFVVNQVNTSEVDCTKDISSCDLTTTPDDASGWSYAYLARSFYPSTPASNPIDVLHNRQIRIDLGSWYSKPPNLTLTGILRHELGHTLGFRHEHTRLEAGTCFEDNNWDARTPYDSASVMHYPQCNGTAGWAMQLTDLDAQGAASVYGPGTESEGARAIRRKWESMGATGGWLGAPTSDVFNAANNGVGRHFQGGSIYWLPNVGAWSIKGAIRQRWSELNWEWSYLGYPTTDETDSCYNGKYNHFQGGTIFWQPDVGAFDVYGGIRDKWLQMGGACGRLGYPVSAETGSTSGTYFRTRRFSKGAIYWYSWGAAAISGFSYNAWKLRYQSSLGKPIQDTYVRYDGYEETHFEHGTMYYTREWGIEVELDY